MEHKQQISSANSILITSYELQKLAKQGQATKELLKCAAIKEEVDIIFMNFAFEEDYPDLRKATKDACSVEGIVIICSTADQGNNSSKMWPTSYEQGPTVVAVYNSYGKLAPFNSDVGADDFFQGINIATEMVPYVKTPLEVSGSSVATAVAAGVAALILACHRIVVYPNLSKNERKTFVNRHFKKMALDADNKEGQYVKPWEGLKVAERLSKGGSGDRWLWNTFKGKEMEPPNQGFLRHWQSTEKK